ncbi:hypothetical protein IFM89_000570 [Coptis chinensis]|uniref:DUF2921 domain-containing protein n=1 Tax=Coptis chinensis TaxID=261450 RepID=A0A835IKW6_9MAGN|nr:hypothetical protein IFM89_000570 [Coptis chinensis]
MVISGSLMKLLSHFHAKLFGQTFILKVLHLDLVSGGFLLIRCRINRIVAEFKGMFSNLSAFKVGSMFPMESKVSFEGTKSSRFKTRIRRFTVRRNKVSINLNGFWSDDSRKLCMVGTGVGYSKEGYSKEGNLLDLSAVFKLNYLNNGWNWHRLFKRRGRVVAIGRMFGDRNNVYANAYRFIVDEILEFNAELFGAKGQTFGDIDVGSTITWPKTFTNVI